MQNLRRLWRFIVHQVLGILAMPMLWWRRRKLPARPQVYRPRHTETRSDDMVDAIRYMMQGIKSNQSKGGES